MASTNIKPNEKSLAYFLIEFQIHQLYYCSKCKSLLILITLVALPLKRDFLIISLTVGWNWPAILDRTVSEKGSPALLYSPYDSVQAHTTEYSGVLTSSRRLLRVFINSWWADCVADSFTYTSTQQWYQLSTHGNCLPGRNHTTNIESSVIEKKFCYQKYRTVHSISEMTAYYGRFIKYYAAI